MATAGDTVIAGGATLLKTGSLLDAWRAAMRDLSATPPDHPEYHERAVAVARAWVAYQSATNPPWEGALVLIADDQRRYVALMDRAGLLGGRDSDLIGSTVDESAPPHLRDAVEPAWRRFLAEGQQTGTWSLATSGGTIECRFEATANTPVPGLHLSVLRPVERAEPATNGRIREVAGARR